MSKIGQMVTCGELPKQYHLVGDAAYGKHVNLMVPYPGQELIAVKQLHNTRHSSTRMVIERSFSDFKGRFLKLKSLDCSLDFAVHVIGACVVLHNICIINRDIQCTSDSFPQGVTNLTFNDANSKRDAIALLL